MTSVAVGALTRVFVGAGVNVRVGAAVDVGKFDVAVGKSVGNAVDVGAEGARTSGKLPSRFAGRSF